MSERNSMPSGGADDLASYLSAEIAAGRLGAGAKLPAERVLSTQFGISRGAVRRILGELSARGLIKQIVGSGTFVSGDTATTATPLAAVMRDARRGAIENTSPSELMAARLIIEPQMAQLIVMNASAADFAFMHECLVHAEQATTLEDFEHWDAEFHLSLAKATHNSFIMEVIRLSNRVREQGEWGRLKRKSVTPERRRQYQAEHRQIIEMLVDRDESAAAEAIRGHLEGIRRNLFS